MYQIFDYSDNPRKAAMDFVKKRGVKSRPIGEGLFAKVYSTGKKARRVYKVFTVDIEEYDAYLEYLSYIVDMQENPFVPKIFYTMEWRSPKETAYVVCMERLECISADSDEDDDIHNGYGSPEMLEELALNFHPKSPLNKFIDKRLVSILKVINKLLEDSDPDIHYGNIMRRRNGQLVITDPVS